MVTTITKTIAATGGDYATFTLAEADVENIGTSADLVANDEAIVFEAEAGTYSESVNFNSSLTTDATRQVTYKPAVGSEHGGVAGGGVVISSSSINFTRDDYMILDGVEVNGSSSQAFNIQLVTGLTIRNCIVDASVQCMVIGAGAVDLTVENCVLSSTNYTIYANDSSGTISMSVRNCTVLAGPAGLSAIRIAQSGTATIDSEFVNCLHLVGAGGVYIESGTVTTTGSNNFGGSTNPFPAAIQGSPHPVTTSTAYDPGAGDYAIYVGKNGALLDSPNNDVIDGGVGPDTDSNVPTTDILGDTRSGTTVNPGAFELPQATAVLTKTIATTGGDYATFTLAEADVENIGGSADLVFENERIEFEVEAGTYSESVNFQSSLTTDATRQVTYKPAAGSEHGGVFGGGVVLEATGGTDNQLQDDYMALDGLEFTAAGVIGTVLQVQPSTTGISINQCLISNPDYKGVRINDDVLAFSLFNCVFSTPSQESIYLLESSGTTTFSVINCTFLRSPALATGKRAVFMSASGTASVLAEFVNCLALEVDRVMTDAGVTLTGSNNFGGSTNPFPTAIQGSPYPITATTNTTPGFGDYAIYNASTGALVVVADNAALGGGVGPAANADVPVLDINGVQRIGGGCDPGAFEGDRARETDLWESVVASYTTPGSFGELMQQIHIAALNAASSRATP